MASVPYSPVPEVAPSGQGISPMHVTVPEGAFGGPIGQALNKFGAVLEHSGDELFKTAMQLQEQKNEAEAIEGDARLANKLTTLQEQFITKEGKNASEGLMDYTAEVDKARKEIRDSLSNDAVRRKYDRNALRSQEIAVRGGASHAGKELRKYSHDAEQAGINLEKQRVIDNPNDPTEAGEARVEQLVWQAGRRFGKDDKTIEAEARFQKGEVVSNRIDALANEKPEEAQKLLNLAIAEKKLWGNEAPKLQDKINRKLLEVEMRHISEAIASNPTVTLEEGMKQAKEMAEEKRPGDPVFRDHVVNDTIGKINKNKAVKREDRLDAQNTVDEAIMNDKVHTFDDLLSQNPGIEKVIERTGGTYKRTIQNKINGYQAAHNKPINDAEMERLIALRRDLPLEFSEIDPTKLPLNTQQMKEVAGWLRADAKKPLAQNPQVNRAVQWIQDAMKPELKALNLGQRKGNEDEYDRFRGSVYVMIDWYNKTYGKYPDQEAVINKLAPMMIKRTMANYSFWGRGETEVEKPSWFTGLGVKEKPLFQRAIPKQFEEDIRNAIRRKEGREMESFDVERAWWRSWLEDPATTEKRYGRGE